MSKEKPNRKRFIKKEARYTPNEWTMIQDRMKRCNIKTYSEYSRRMLIDGGILVIDDSKEIKALIAEVNKIGININQIAHVANATETVTNESISELKEMMYELWQLIRTLL